MSERITLELPDTLAQAAREEAERTGQTVEAVLLKWIQKSYDEKYVSQDITSGATYEVDFLNTKSAADLLAFLNSQNDASGPST